MASTLIITPVEDLHEKIGNVLKGLEGTLGIYISLNKTEKSINASFTKKGIDVKKVFFIDCVAKEKSKEDVLYTSPSNLNEIIFSIKTFLDNIEGEKFIIIDALSTLLIYNNENNVATFVNDLLKHSSPSTEILAFSPETKGEELLKKIFNFFDKVEKY